MQYSPTFHNYQPVFRNPERERNIFYLSSSKSTHLTENEIFSKTEKSYSCQKRNESKPITYDYKPTVLNEENKRDYKREERKYRTPQK